MVSEAKCIPFEHFSNDLYASLKCTCPFTTTTGQTLEFVKNTIRLVGYCDSNFFDNVNREPQQQKCPHCGREFSFQWTREGVAIEWADGGEVLSGK